MKITATRFRPDDADLWDIFCKTAVQATLLHTRKFLAYHQSRFIDRSVILKDDNQWVGVFPAAEDPSDKGCIISHPGITYGGLIHDGGLRGNNCINAFDAILEHYRREGFGRLIYKPVPHIYHRLPAQDDLYALFRLGAHRRRCDLSSAVDLTSPIRPHERRRRSLAKAKKANVEIVEGRNYLPQLWDVLIDNLARKHDTKPTHSLAEISLLTEWFPDEIRTVCAQINGTVHAGVIIFVTPTVYHAQYIASSNEGYAACALDAVFAHAITEAAASGRHWFDFGISNESGGMILNEGLYKFKTEFGGGGAVHEFYELNIPQ